MFHTFLSVSITVSSVQNLNQEIITCFYTSPESMSRASTDLLNFCLLHHRNRVLKNLTTFPSRTWVTYSIRIFLGIILHEKWKISKSHMKCFWLFTVSMFAISYFVPNSWERRDSSNLEKVVFGCSYRTLMAMFLAVLFYWSSTFKELFVNLLNLIFLTKWVTSWSHT